MRGDTELNIAIEDEESTEDLRVRIWHFHLNNIKANSWQVKNYGKPTLPDDWYQDWGMVLKENDIQLASGLPRIAAIFSYHEELNARFNLG